MNLTVSVALLPGDSSAVFFLLMVGAVAAGVTVTVKVQIIMSTIEVALLVLFAALALFHAHHVTSFSWNWFSLSIFHHKGSGTFADGALIAAFFYWGWDVTANLNEETKEPKSTSGLGGVIGVFLATDLFLFFLFWEVMLIPMAFLIGIWGHDRRIYAAVKFFIYTMFGSAFMLVGILWLYTVTGSLDLPAIQ